MTSVRDAAATRERLYHEMVESFGAPLARLARAYEPDHERRRDLLQEIHLALWRSLAVYDGRCSVRTWVYRVAHNTATSLVFRRRAGARAFVSLDDLDVAALPADRSDPTRGLAIARVFDLVQRLRPLERQVMLLYLEGCAAGEIGDITGLSPSHVATKIHRIKQVLTRQFHGELP